MCVFVFTGIVIGVATDCLICQRLRFKVPYTALLLVRDSKSMAASCKSTNRREATKHKAALLAAPQQQRLQAHLGDLCDPTRCWARLKLYLPTW